MTAWSAATRLWCEHALLPGGPADGVTIEIVGGRITSVTPGSDTRPGSGPRPGSGSPPGTGPPPGAERRLGATVPGAANAHSHAFHRLLRHRSQTGGGSFWTWREQMYAMAGALDPDRYHRLARAVFAEMVLSGYTVVGEFHYLHHQPDGTPYDDPNAMGEAVAQAAADAGIRLTLLDTIYLHGGLAAQPNRGLVAQPDRGLAAQPHRGLVAQPDHGLAARQRSGFGSVGHLPLSPAQRRFGDASVEAWVDRVSGLALSDRCRVGAAVHSVRAVDPEAISAVAGWAAAKGLPLHAHVSEQPAENEQCRATYGCTPVELLASAGAIGPTFTAVHATHLTDGDVALLGSAGATVCLCPTTERDLGDGIGPARRLADAGVSLAIGSDSHAVIDPFEEGRAIELDQRLLQGRRGCFSPAELVGAMTGGHRSLGWDDAGAIEVGRRADLVTVAIDSVRTAGSRPGAVAEAAVFGATAADVTHVMIDGVEVVVDGRHRHLDVAAELEAAIGDIVSVAGAAR